MFCICASEITTNPKPVGDIGTDDVELVEVEVVVAVEVAVGVEVEVGFEGDGLVLELEP